MQPRVLRSLFFDLLLWVLSAFHLDITHIFIHLPLLLVFDVSFLSLVLQLLSLWMYPAFYFPLTAGPSACWQWPLISRGLFQRVLRFPSVRRNPGFVPDDWTLFSKADHSLTVLWKSVTSASGILIIPGCTLINFLL